MQDIREIEFRDSRSITNTKICFEVRVTTLRPRLHTEGFPLYVHTEPPTKRTSTEEFATTNLGVYNSSLQHNHLYTRGKARSQNNNHLYTKRDEHKAKQQSPHTRGIRH